MRRRGTDNTTAVYVTILIPTWQTQQLHPGKEAIIFICCFSFLRSAFFAQMHYTNAVRAVAGKTAILR